VSFGHGHGFQCTTFAVCSYRNGPSLLVYGAEARVVLEDIGEQVGEGGTGARWSGILKIVTRRFGRGGRGRRCQRGTRLGSGRGRTMRHSQTGLTWWCVGSGLWLVYATPDDQRTREFDILGG
jgi:hypothetical protein